MSQQSNSLLNRYLQPEVLNYVAQHEFRAAKLVVGRLAGQHRSPAAGFAVEFTGHREYTPGDDPRHIDWRVFYARDKFVVKQYDLETNFVCHLLLDRSPSMFFGEGDSNKWEFAKRLATLLAYAILQQNDQFSLVVFDDQVRSSLPPGNRWDQFLRLVTELDECEPGVESDFGRALAEAAQFTQRREIVVVISDFMSPLDSLERSLQRFCYSGHDVLLLQLIHPLELDLDLAGTVRFDDLETGESMVCRPDDFREAYQEELQAMLHECELMAQRNDCQYLLLNTGRDLRESIIDVLKRS